MNMKKTVLLMGGLIALLLVAAVAVPLFVDVDRYRPQLVEKANSLINGRVDLGKLKLSLWGRIKVDVAGLQLQDSKNRKVVSVADASFVLPFSSVLSGSPRLTLVMDKPAISVVRDSQGELNVVTLMKKSTAAPQESAPGAVPAPKSSEVQVPAIVARSRLGVEIRDGALQFLDEKAKLESKVDGLQLHLKDASVTQPTQLTVEALLDTKVGQQVRLKGPVRLDLDTTPVISGSEIKELGASLQAEAGDLEIEMPGLFQKKKGIPLSVTGRLAIGSTEARVDSFSAKFHNAEISFTGKVDQLTTEPKLALKARTNGIDLKPWDALVPMLQPFQLSGKTTLDLDIGGSASALRYGGNLQLEAISFTHPTFKANPRLDGSIRIATNQLENIALTMTAPDSDLKMTGKVVDFLKPRVTLDATGSMDLDQWIDFTKPKQLAAAAATAAASGSPAPGAGGKVPVQDLDALLDPMRKNAIALATEVRVNLKLQKFKAYQAPMSNVAVVATMKDLAVNLEAASLRLFEGSAAFTGKMDMKPTKPTYSFTAKVDGLQLHEAVESQFSFLKNTLLGKLSAIASGSGASFNVDPAIRALEMKGSFDVKQARFSTLDITKMAFEGINQSLAKVAEKVPALKGRGLGAPGSRESAYEFIRSKFQISGGKFNAPDFEAKAEPNKGIDLKARVAVNLRDLSLDTKFELIDTYNLTRAKDMSADVAGVPVKNLLAEKGKPVVIPISVGCTVAKPCPSYMELPDHFSRVALANLGGSAKEKFKSEAKKQLGDAIKKALPGGFNKLFR
jgi:AsmA protein